MNIAVFGSWSESRRKWGLRYTQDEFALACRSLGASISKLGHSVIVGSSSPNTADRYIVEGILAEISGSEQRHPLIRVIRPKDKYDPYQLEEKQYPSLFQFYYRGESWWEAAHMIAIRKANAILTIGGARGTYLAGLAAITAKKKLIPIGSFGGASSKLLEILEPIFDDDKNTMSKLHAPWSDLTLKNALTIIGILGGPKLLIIHGRGDDWRKLKRWLEKALALRKITVMEFEYGVGLTLPEKWETIAFDADAAIVVATPDDVGKLKATTTGGYKPRARQNIWVEVGWFWGRLGRQHILFLTKGELEIPSDLQGLELCKYNNSPLEMEQQIRKFIDIQTYGDQ